MRQISGFTKHIRAGRIHRSSQIIQVLGFWGYEVLALIFRHVTGLTVVGAIFSDFNGSDKLKFHRLLPTLRFGGRAP